MLHYPFPHSSHAQQTQAETEERHYIYHQYSINDHESVVVGSIPQLYENKVTDFKSDL